MDDVSHILDPLNDAQREAVTAPAGTVLVLAGAGSGKTRVLVHRIAWLIQVERVPPWSLLAVTFTNKAAREMRGRIEEMLGQPAGGMWVGTFHGLAHRFLRAHWQDAGLPQQFQILDSDDQLRLVKRVLKALQLDESHWPPRQLQGFINKQKDEGLRPQHLDPAGDFYLERQVAAYREYEEARARGGLLDFADLLLCAHELLRERADILHHYQTRFRAILVDEFQDTNAIQYAWLRLLAGANDNLFAVGDDDQSIYGWRGARVENIQSFQRDYAGTRVIRLEQNYRSTGNILQAANALIANNPTRLGKNLWTEDREGEPIRRYAAFNEVEEARFVIERIRRYTADDGYRRDECAILYRTTAQSRLFEESLMNAQIPYRVYGGLRFFERAEIRDALAYLRLVSNPDDDAAFERVVNTPTRGIGERTLDLVRQHARGARVSLWRAAEDLVAAGSLGGRASAALARFIALIGEQREGRAGMELEALAASLLEAAGLAEHYQKAKDGKGEDRVENLEQLLATTERFRLELEDEDGDALTGLPRPRGAGGRRGPGGRPRRRRPAHDPAQRQGARVPDRLPHRTRGGALSPQPLRRGPQPARGGASALLRGHDPRHAPALPYPRGVAPAAWTRGVSLSLPLRPRGPRRADRGGARRRRRSARRIRLTPRNRPGQRRYRERPAPRPTGASRQVRRGRGAQHRGPRGPGAGAGELRRCRREMAGRGLCPARATRRLALPATAATRASAPPGRRITRAQRPGA